MQSAARVPGLHVCSLAGAAPPVDHLQLSVQLPRVDVASLCLVIGPPLVVEIAQNRSRAGDIPEPSISLRSRRARVLPTFRPLPWAFRPAAGWSSKSAQVARHASCVTELHAAFDLSDPVRDP